MECIRVAYHLCEVDEPMAKTIQDAKSSEHANEKKNALDSEYNSLIENRTWKFVELAPGPRKATGCKRVLKVKNAEDGRVDRFKARLAAKGYPKNKVLITMKLFSHGSLLLCTFSVGFCGPE